MQSNKYTLITDGSCLSNPGTGAWAYRILDINGDLLYETSQAEHLTTNNRMELTAILKGMQKISDTSAHITIITDSRYIVDGANIWMHQWIKNNWVTKQKNAVKNQDLWIKLYNLLSLYSNASLIWTKGHATNHQHNLVDKLARDTAINYSRSA